MQPLGNQGSPQRVVAIVALACGLLLGGCGGGKEAGPQESPHASGWEKLPLPPEVRDRLAFVATDERVLAFGGCAPEPHDRCDPTADGFAFDPSARVWREIPSAPYAVLGSGVWTGDEVVFLDTGGEGALRGVGYDPDTESWRALPPAPLRAKGSDATWTGSEVIVWGGGGRRGPAAEAGAAYDPATNTWRRIADAPFSLNAVSLVWTGSELIAFGSRLDFRNRSTSPNAIAIAYEPATDRWRRLADSSLSPQAHAAEWVGDRMVAYDYGTRSQSYEPGENRWSAKRQMPLEPGECYPDSTKIGRSMLAFYCGQVAALEPGSKRWSIVNGGLTERVNRSNTYGQELRVWRFARLAAIEETAYFLAEGITFSRRGEAQYGFQGSPASFWSFTAR